MDRNRKVVFISYSSADRDVALEIKNNIPDEFDVWLDAEKLRPGDEISPSIQQALNGSDYFTLIISEASNRSAWVRKEIATAFELANNKKLSVVPFLLKSAPVPLEFKGLLYIDARPSLASGIKTLREFFIQQASLVSKIDPRQVLLKSDSPAVRRRLECNELLRALSLGDLRHHVSERLSIEEIEVIWFDLFHRKMSDEVQVRNVALSSVELIDRSRRNDLLVDLVDTLCRNRPNLSTFTSS